MEPVAPTTKHLDAHGITVLAHPIRSRILSYLRQRGASTATDLAAALQTNTGATSYHLRKLDEVGLVEESAAPADAAPGRGGRQRWWKPTTDRHSFVASDVAGDPDAIAAHNWLERHYLQLTTEQFSAWLDESASWPLDWQDASGLSDFSLTLSPTRARALADEMGAVLERFRTEPAEPAVASDDSSAPARVRVHVLLHPATEHSRD